MLCLEFASSYNSQVQFIRERKYIKTRTKVSFILNLHRRISHLRKLRLKVIMFFQCLSWTQMQKSSLKHQQIKFNDVRKKLYTTAKWGLYPRYIRLVQCSNINWHNPSYQQATEKTTTWTHAEKAKSTHDFKKQLSGN